MALSADADLFLDIGAYTGLFALAVAKAHPHVRTEAFEIVPENFLMLARHVVFNGLSGCVTPRLVGLGDASGVLRLPIRMGLTQAPSSISLETRFEEGIEVPVATLDDLFGAFAGRAVFKLDVEGFEPAVLNGGRRLLERVRPDMVCEVLRSADTGAALAQILRPLGYRAWVFTEAGLRPHEEWRAVREGRDWLLSCDSDEQLASRLGKVPICG